MIVAYVSFVFLIIGAVIFRDRIEFVFPVIYSFFVMVMYSLAIPHVGALYRYRYAYFMLLVTLGITVAIKLWCEAVSHRKTERISAKDPKILASNLHSIRLLLI
jgi:putative Ca2+/H+ antiporter (TMEM165/GDT1 family)